MKPKSSKKKTGPSKPGTHFREKLISVSILFVVEAVEYQMSSGKFSIYIENKCLSFNFLKIFWGGTKSIGQHEEEEKKKDNLDRKCYGNLNSCITKCISPNLF